MSQINRFIMQFSMQKGESPILVPILNFGFYSGVIPYKLVFSESKNAYFVEEHQCQKLICKVSNVGSICIMFHAIYLGLGPINSDSSGDIVKYIYFFDLISNTCAVMSNITLTFIFWKRKNETVELVERTRLHSLRFSEASVKITKTLVIFVLICLTLFFFVIHFAICVHRDPIKVKTDSDSFWTVLKIILYVLLFQFGLISPLGLMLLVGIFVAFKQIGQDFQNDMIECAQSNTKNVTQVNTDAITY